MLSVPVDLPTISIVLVPIHLFRNPFVLLGMIIDKLNRISETK